jgi:hypothetical protein
MVMLQLDPPIPLMTPKGEGLAHFIIDYGLEFDLLWVCFQRDTGECWTWANPDIRAVKNITFDRKNVAPLSAGAVPGKPRQVFPLDPA